MKLKSPDYRGIFCIFIKLAERRVALPSNA